MTTPNNLVYERAEGFTDTPTHYCPGCTHGVAHRLVAEVLEEWVLFRVSRNLELPIVDGLRIEIKKVA